MSNDWGHDLEIPQWKIACFFIRTHLCVGGKFVSCVALGRVFGASFHCCPRPRAALGPRPCGRGLGAARGRGHALRKVAPKILPRATRDATFPRQDWVWIKAREEVLWSMAIGKGHVLRIREAGVLHFKYDWGDDPGIALVQNSLFLHCHSLLCRGKCRVSRCPR